MNTTVNSLVKYRLILYLSILLNFLFHFKSVAQLKQPNLLNISLPKWYSQQAAVSESIPLTSGEIIFPGSNFMGYCKPGEVFKDDRIIDRLDEGENTLDIMMQINKVVKRRPSKIFLFPDINNPLNNFSIDSVIKKVQWIAKRVHQETPSTKLYIQSMVYPGDDNSFLIQRSTAIELISKLNSRLADGASTFDYTFVDIQNVLAGIKLKSSSHSTKSEVYRTRKACLLWKHFLFPFIYDLQEKPSLIPRPEKLTWKKGVFPLYNCKTIVVGKGLTNEALFLKSLFSKMGINMSLTETERKGYAIKLKLGKVQSIELEEEAYCLEAADNEVSLTANTAHGIFNGIQTLTQLARDSTFVDNCTITDRPSFMWRGYMVDVGRNYMSPELLKEQIDIMSKYKLNVFQFHATEDIAWRFPCKIFPQLLAPEYMSRNKEKFYTESEIKELIAYCKKRHIVFVPEIDMPGHSRAFRLAMRTDMQSDSGLLMVRSILKEVCQNYDVPYIHIGGDEVKITKQNFIPEVTALIESFGKKVIAWKPGGNLTKETIRQLWMGDIEATPESKETQYIDSRHLYLNHLDPLESVVTIFNRRIADKEKGDNNAIGAAICLWHDRIVADESDMLKMNPVYPSILTFAERSWLGGGKTGWITNIGEPDSDKAKSFEEFERRLLDNKFQYFKSLPFNYVRQSNLVWELIGPFHNEGDLTRAFDPELNPLSSSGNSIKVVGGTIVLRHWWYPVVTGVIKNPEENTTWYAATTIWSDDDKEKEFWIGFNNLSRSMATNSPPNNLWDNRQSCLWVNGISIAPPDWNRAGQMGNAEVPLIDEGYEYRNPTKIFLQKGWNRILVKLPVGNFKSNDWQNPVKWMFTFVPLN